MLKKIELGEWKTRTQNGTTKGLSSTYSYRERIKYRECKIDDALRLEEMIILEYLSKIKGEKEDFKPAQQHLIGYHYIGVTDSSNKDVFWIQGNIKSKNPQYAVYKGRGENAFDVYQNWIGKTKAFVKFCEGLKKLFNVDLKTAIVNVDVITELNH